MNFKMNGSALRKSVGVALMMVVPAFAGAQHKASAPAPHAAPAAHASAPSHASTPSHANTASHTTTTSHAATTSHTTTPNRSATTTHTNTTSHTTTPSHTTTANHAATTSHTTTTSHTATTSHSTTAGHGATTTHTTTASRTTTTSHTPPGRNVSLKGGGSASVRPNGQVRSINRNGTQINRGLHGGRTVVTNRNGARIVSNGRRGGYVQRAYVTRGGRSYYSRTYYYHGGYRVGVYRGYYWGGHNYYGYYHPYWYHPGFYGWAYNPWAAPVAWGWGWGGSPWYGYYGAYWNPYPVYPSAAFWLTDYLIAANLQAAYAAQAEANAAAADSASNADASNDQVASNGGQSSAPSQPTGLSPEVKQAIADEVKAQLAAAQTESSQAGSSSGGGAAAPAASTGQVPPALDPARRIFVVADEVDVTADGQECALTQGDVITRLTDTPDGDQKVNVSVTSSKKGDCAAGKSVLVAVDDLQEMHNHFQEQLDAGMKELAAKQGTGGLPKAPDTGTTASDVPAPAPDKTAAKSLEDQDKSADQTEADVKQETASGGGSQ
jgi:hypothetical protein